MPDRNMTEWTAHTAGEIGASLGIQCLAVSIDVFQIAFYGLLFCFHFLKIVYDSFFYFVLFVGFFLEGEGY